MIPALFTNISIRPKSLWISAALSEEVKTEWAKKIPLRRGGTPEDVADVATFLASDMSAYVSGQVIQVDGGMNM